MMGMFSMMHALFVTTLFLLFCQLTGTSSSATCKLLAMLAN